MARSKSDLLSWDGSWHEIAKAIINAVLDKNGTDEDIRQILKNPQVAKDIATCIIATRPGAKSEPAKPTTLPLIGTVVKTLHLQPCKVSSLAAAIKSGKYDYTDGDIATLFADDELGLAESVNVDLVKFDRDPLYEQMLAWGKENGKKYNGLANSDSAFMNKNGI